MTKAQTRELEQAVRKVLGEVLSEASDGPGSPGATRGMGARAFGGAGTTVAELAEALDQHQRPAEMLLTGCAALGLLE